MQFPDLIAALTPVVTALERLGVPYYLAGSVASTRFGHARMTQDVDLVADLMPHHAAALAEALQGTYYANAGAMTEAIARKSCFNVIHLATHFKVDVFTVKDRRYDRTVLQRIQKQAIDKDDPSRQFYFASAEDVVLSKLEWYRLGDEVSDTQWRDVIGVMEVQHDSLDRSYLSKWGTELGVADLLQRAWSELIP